MDDEPTRGDPTGIRALVLESVRSLLGAGLFLAVLLGVALAGVVAWFVTFVGLAFLGSTLPEDVAWAFGLVGFFGGLVLAGIVIVIGYRHLIRFQRTPDRTLEVTPGLPIPREEARARALARAAEADARLAPLEDPDAFAER